MNTDRFTDWDTSGFFADEDDVMKSTPSLSDVHSPTASTPLARRKKKMKPKPGEVEVTMSLEKSDEDQRMAWGWASVTTLNGQPLEDLQGDVIETEELQKAVHEFVRKKRVMGEMHTIIGTGDIVDSIVLTKDLQRAMGIDLGKEGWFVGVHVTNDSTWSKVKKGELRGFSLGGFGVRELMKSMGDDEEAVELDLDDLSERMDFLEAVEDVLEKTSRKPAGSPGGTGGQFSGGPAGFGNSGVARRAPDTAARSARDARMASRVADDWDRRRTPQLAQQAREHMTLARAARASGDAKSSAVHAYKARLKVREARGQKFGWDGLRNPNRSQADIDMERRVAERHHQAVAETRARMAANPALAASARRAMDEQIAQNRRSVKEKEW
jgi:hypothetical protein